MNSKAKSIEEREYIILSPSNNKVLVRKSDGARFFGELTLGFTYYLNNKLLDEPHWEIPDDYTEDDMTEEELKHLGQWEYF